MGRRLTPHDWEAADWAAIRHPPRWPKGTDMRHRRHCPAYRTRYGAEVSLKGEFADQCAFLVCGGPSLATEDLSLLHRPGILTMGVNNSPVKFRPNLWVEVDSPANFVMSVWRDPTILKFCPQDHAEKPLFDNMHWTESATKVGECPHVVYFVRSKRFDHETFLSDQTIQWGNEKDVIGSAGYKGCRSVMLCAIRILYDLGFRCVFLLGVDFRMALEQANYAWDQARSKGSVKNNIQTYAALNTRFKLLRPKLEKAGMHVFNCNPESGLRAFDHMPLAKAVEYALEGWPLPEWDDNARCWTLKERLRGPTTVEGLTEESGLYDRQALIKRLKKQAGKEDEAKSGPRCPTSEEIDLDDLRKAVRQ
jgi:hypothetical protein